MRLQESADSGDKENSTVTEAAWALHGPKRSQTFNDSLWLRGGNGTKVTARDGQIFCCEIIN